MEPTIAELRAMSDEEIIQRHDAQTVHTVIGTKFYLDELARRDAARVSNEVGRYTKEVTILTRWIFVLTIVITILTAVSAAFTIMPAFK